MANFHVHSFGVVVVVIRFRTAGTINNGALTAYTIIKYKLQIPGFCVLAFIYVTPLSRFVCVPHTSCHHAQGSDGFLPVSFLVAYRNVPWRTRGQSGMSGVWKNSEFASTAYRRRHIGADRFGSRCRRGLDGEGRGLQL